MLHTILWKRCVGTNGWCWRALFITTTAFWRSTDANWLHFNTWIQMLHCILKWLVVINQSRSGKSTDESRFRGFSWRFKLWGSWERGDSTFLVFQIDDVLTRLFHYAVVDLPLVTSHIHSHLSDKVVETYQSIIISIKKIEQLLNIAHWTCQRQRLE